MDFAEALARLFVQAGRPTLRAAAARASVSAQRISDWRNGRHLPRDFSTVEPLLVWLTTRAISAGSPDVLTIPQWHELWDEHVSEDTGEVVRPRPESSCPYAGLAPLGPAESAFFFGRDDLVADLVDMILAAGEQTSEDGSEPSRLIVVTGVSGSGKSSLLGAGLARDKRLEATAVHLTVTRDGIDFDGLDPESQIAPESQVATEPQIVVLDQFENVFALDPTVLASTMCAVDAHARRGIVIVGVRADFFGQCVEFDFLAEAWRRRCVIVPELTRAQLREVITAPSGSPAGGSNRVSPTC